MSARLFYSRYHRHFLSEASRFDSKHAKQEGTPYDLDSFPDCILGPSFIGEPALLRVALN